MQFRKIAAVAGSALMAGLSLAGAALAQTNVGEINDIVKVSGSTVNFPLFVVGATAKSDDVAGAINVAVRLAADASKPVAVTGGSSVTGIDRDGITPCYATTPSTNCLLNKAKVGGSAFPTTDVIMKNAHFTGLKDSTFSWKSNDYDYSEQVDLSGVYMSHSLTTDKINGTETMVIGTNGAIKYEYVFDKAINLSSARTTGNYGLTTNPEYTYPIKVKILGKDITIVGVGATEIKALAGSSGTADATTGITYGDYTAYATSGSDASWSKVVVKDKSGAVVDTLIISDGNSKDSSATGLTVKVTLTRALQDGTIQGSDIVVGPTGTTEHSYDNSADVTSTGTGSDRFPGETAWGIEYVPSATSGNSATGCDVAGAGCILKNTQIRVTYKPSDTQYLKAGSKISLPNDYGELGFDGFNTDNFATVTVKAIKSGMTAYFANGTQSGWQNLYGLEISSDKSGVIYSSASNQFTKAYLLFNASMGSGNVYQPVAVGFYDNTLSKIIVNYTTGSAYTTTANGEYAMGYLNASAGVDQGSAVSGYNLSYQFKISNGGNKNFYVDVQVVPQLAQVLNVTIGNSSTLASNTIRAFFENKTAWVTGGDGPKFRLGGTEGSGDDWEIRGATEGATVAGENFAKKSQDVLDDSGLKVTSTATSAGTDAVIVMVPSDELGIKAHFGKPGATATTEGTVQEAIPVTADVVKLDTEVTAADKTAYNFIVVGGPAVNSLAADLMGVTFPSYGAASGIPENAALVQVFVDKFATGNVAVLVAGWEAQNTRDACRAIQTGILDGNTEDAVKVTGTTAADVVAYTAPVAAAAAE